MFVINPKLAATCFVVVPAIVYASRIFGDYMRTLSTETQDSLAEANSVAEEVVAAISTTLPRGGGGGAAALRDRDG